MTMNCIYCGKEFKARVRNQKTCGGTECKIKLNRELTRIHQQNKKQEAMRKKETKKNPLNDIAKEAAECGMTYGQYVALNEMYQT